MVARMKLNDLILKQFSLLNSQSVVFSKGVFNHF